MFCRINRVVPFLLFCYVNNISSQHFNSNPGVPLPSFKSGQGRGVLLTNDKASPKLNFKSSHPNSVASRGLGSLQYIANPSGDKYVQNLVKHPILLRGIQQKTRADQAVRIESIITAHKQVVSGQIIYLTLRVVEVECPVGTQNVARCPRDHSEDPYICEMAIWERPWLNSTKLVEEKSRCEESESDVSFKNWKKGSDDGFDNGYLEYPMASLPQPLDQDQIALEAFNFIDRASQSKFKGKMLKHTLSSVKYNPVRNVSKIEVKIEYGLTLCIKLASIKVDTRACPLDGQRNTFVCSVDVASDPRSPTRYEVIPDDDDDLDCDEKQPVEELLVVPVSAPCTGCPQSISLSDPKVQHLAEFAIEEYDRESDDDDLHKVKRIIKAHYQVESSIKYLLTLEVVETNCKKFMSAINMNRTFCHEDPLDTPEICDFLILDQPWQKSKELLDVKCSDRDDYDSGISKDEFIIPVVGSPLHSGAQGGASSPARLSSLRASPETSTPISSGLQGSIDFVLDSINHMQDSIEHDDDHDDFDDDGLMVLQKVHLSDSKVGPNGEEQHHLIIELGETICSKLHHSANCPLKHGEENEVCEVLVLVGQSSQRRISYLSCEDLDHYMMKKVTPYQHLHQPFFSPQNQQTRSRTLPTASTPQKSFENDPTALEVANLVLNQYNLQSDEDALYKLGHIASFVMQGSGYLVELELLETECKKYQPVLDVTKCPLDFGEDPQFCQAEVSGNKRVTKLYCDDREDFFKKKIARAEPSSHPGEWKAVDITSEKAKGLGSLIADEFDLRSDKDNIFILHRIIDARTQSAGLRHYIKVELAETFCPKYKPRINKTRCMIDNEEDFKLCHAIIIDQPWNNGHEVKDLSCSEKDRSHEDRSIEIHYSSVSPSAHVRPKFIKSVYFKNLGSQESDESNEKYYQHGRYVHHSNERDSDEILSDFLTTGRRRILGHHSRPIGSFGRVFGRDDDRYDSDNDKDSHSQEDGRLRFRRSVQQHPIKEVEASSFEGTEAVGLNQGVWDLAIKALDTLDALTKEKTTRKVEDILQASKKVLPQGLQWMLTLRVSESVCPKKISSEKKSLVKCKTAKESITYLCSINLIEETNTNSLQIKKSKCYSELS